jgi:NAD(P)-dependent dehydrogenase (short-subunit alcohol dehydrogenase family)
MILKDKTAIITGAGQGIGRAIAECFAKEGARVALIGRTPDKLEETRKRIELQGGSAYVHACDLCVEDAVRDMISSVLQTFGSMDVLVNNAGMSCEQPLEKMPMELFDEIMRVNLRSAVMTSKYSLSALGQRKGSIVNIASCAGLRGLPGSCAYSAAKSALITFSQALGDEVRDMGIRVNVLCPGPVDTDMFKKSAVRDFLLASGNAVLEPEEIAQAALFLAGSQSGRMSSQVIVMRDKNRW